ncbi:hypothetical protein JXA59_01790 [Patescibacteria group bacterium]|nr:hypothetical protein [Patescibacteria group bacterium]
MIFLGLLSFIQLAILPGWLIVWRWKAPSWLSRVLVAFGVSLLFNHLLVLLLVALGWFCRPVVLSVIGVELLLLLWLLYRNHWAVVPQNATLSISVDLSVDQVTIPKWIRVGLFGAITLIAVSALVTVVTRVLSVNPGVFDIWDDFISFNQWAVDWYNGAIPGGTWWYPQLIPTNWALAYQVIGSSDIQFFVKAVMGLFPIALLFTFVDLFYRSGRTAFLLGLSFTTVLLIALANTFIGSGYVDIPVAFLVFLSGAILFPDMMAKRFLPSHLIIAGLLAASAGLTKQGGLFIILPLLVWVGVMIWANQKNWARVGKWVITTLLVFGVVIAPWYGYKFWQMRMGQDVSEGVGIENALVRAIGEKTLLGKWSYGAQAVALRTSAQLLQSTHLASINNNKLIWNISRQPISRSTALVIMWILMITLVLALVHPVARWSTITVIIPFFLIWATKYSYDFRNLTLVLPFLGMAWGFGLMYLIQLVTRMFNKNKTSGDIKIANHLKVKIPRLPYWISAVILLMVAVVAYWQISYPAPTLYAMHEEKMHSVGMVAINDALYQYYESDGLSGKIRTMYQPAAYLPRLKDYIIADDSSLSLERLKQYEQDPEIHYILWWDSTNNPDALAYLQAQVEMGAYQAIFNVNNYRFVKINAK